MTAEVWGKWCHVGKYLQESRKHYIDSTFGSHVTGDSSPSLIIYRGGKAGQESMHNRSNSAHTKEGPANHRSGALTSTLLPSQHHLWHSRLKRDCGAHQDGDTFPTQKENTRHQPRASWRSPEGWGLWHLAHSKTDENNVKLWFWMMLPASGASRVKVAAGTVGMWTHKKIRAILF